MNYFIIGGDKKEYGPASSEQVQQWIREGRANGDTLLRQENETEWKELRTFDDFKTELPPALPLTVPPSAGMHEDNLEAPVRINHSFARAWHLCGEHFGTVFGACLLVWMAFTAILFIPYVGPYIARLFLGPLLGGLFLVFLKIIREGDASAGDVFALGRENTFSLMLVGIVSTILVEISVCFCILPAIYLQIAWFFAIPLVADRGLQFWEAMETSRRAISPKWFSFFGLFMLAFLPVLVFSGYMFFRMSSELIPVIMANLPTTPGAMPEMARLQTEIQKVQAGYASWALMKQCLLLVSLPLGIGSFAFVYEDFFGKRKNA